MVTVLEKEASKAVRAQSHKLHCGLCQRGVAVESIIAETLSGYEVVFHYFSTVGELYECNQRSYIDLIVFAAGEEPLWEDAQAYHLGPRSSAILLARGAR